MSTSETQDTWFSRWEKTIKEMPATRSGENQADEALVERVACDLAEHFGSRSFAEMASNRAELRTLSRQGYKHRPPYDMNEATKSDCLDAARAVVRMCAQPSSEETGNLPPRPITLQDVRLAAGEGKLTAEQMLAGVNAELLRRWRNAPAQPSTNASGSVAREDALPAGTTQPSSDALREAVEAEREACARMVEDHAEQSLVTTTRNGQKNRAFDLAFSIRARSLSTSDSSEPAGEGER